jgi:acyl carrier protein
MDRSKLAVVMDLVALVVPPEARPKLGPDVDLVDELGFDSIRFIRLVALLEGVTGLNLMAGGTDYFSIRTARDISRLYPQPEAAGIAARPGGKP